jgi:hypothetical protein
MGKAKRNKLARLTALQDRKEQALALERARKIYGGNCLPPDILFELRAMRLGQ